MPTFQLGMAFELFILYLVDGFNLILEFKPYHVACACIPNHVVKFTIVTELLK